MATCPPLAASEREFGSIALPDCTQWEKWDSRKESLVSSTKGRQYKLSGKKSKPCFCPSTSSPHKVCTVCPVGSRGRGAPTDLGNSSSTQYAIYHMDHSGFCNRLEYTNVILFCDWPHEVLSFPKWWPHIPICITPQQRTAVSPVLPVLGRRIGPVP